mmetsp:Transcript_20681/g.28898  ORF Transcript_20681/g.28898 Transcript_20681/m.28898 type:complete len:347 (-) Transcript_20681:305-1345(-)
MISRFSVLQIPELKLTKKTNKIFLSPDRDSESESEPSDDTIESKFNPLNYVSDETVRHISGGSICAMHTTDQCLVRCIQCLESFCSSLASYDIHSEVDQVWSCRSCLLCPRSLFRNSSVEHSAALASPCSSKEASDSDFVESVVKPVLRGPLIPPEKTSLPIPGQKRKAETEPEVDIDVRTYFEDKTLSAGTLPKSAMPASPPKLVPMSGAPQADGVVPTLAIRVPPAKRQRPPRSKKKVSTPRIKDEASPVKVVSKDGALPLPTLAPILKQQPIGASPDDYVTVKGGKRLKRFRCEFCPKRFDQKSNLTAHIRSHTGEKPFTCKVCKRPFSQKSNMTRHMKVHRR